MNRLYIIALLAMGFVGDGFAQEDFTETIATAKTECCNGNLEKARFAFQQTLVAVDE